MILLTGGTGLVGRHTLELLLRRGRRVLALSRSARSSAELGQAGAEVIEGDVADGETWQRIRDVTAIIHSAASVYTGGDWSGYQRVNVAATALAAARAREVGAPLIHISSVAVYGRHTTRPVAEDAAIGSVEDGEFYPRSKRLAEQAVWEEVARGLQAIALRPCVVYGEGDRLFLPKLVRVARRGWFPVAGNGRSVVPLVYAGNVAEGVVAALEAREGWGRAYNLANDDLITADELVAGLSEGLHREVRPVHLPAGPARWAARALDALRPLTGSRLPPVAGGVAFLSGGHPYTSGAAREVLGWKPTHRHRDALPRSVRWVSQSGT
jgi:nucleoside-diphosphate-sugar epimerase